LYGIYLTIASDTDEGWNGSLGEMPPPYQLEITLVTYENIDPDAKALWLLRLVRPNPLSSNFKLIL